MAIRTLTASEQARAIKLLDKDRDSRLRRANRRSSRNDSAAFLYAHLEAIEAAVEGAGAAIELACRRRASERIYAPASVQVDQDIRP